MSKKKLSATEERDRLWRALNSERVDSIEWSGEKWIRLEDIERVFRRKV